MTDEDTAMSDGIGFVAIGPAAQGSDVVFDARLRGVDVTCVVPSSAEVLPDPRDTRIEVSARDLARGLTAVSRFAGYCSRTLVLEDPSADEQAWARVMASYYGFGLAVVEGSVRADVMPPAAVDDSDVTPARQRFWSAVRRYFPGA